MAAQTTAATVVPMAVPRTAAATVARTTAATAGRTAAATAGPMVVPQTVVAMAGLTAAPE